MHAHSNGTVLHKCCQWILYRLMESPFNAKKKTKTKNGKRKMVCIAGSALQNGNDAVNTKGWIFPKANENEWMKKRRKLWNCSKRTFLILFNFPVCFRCAWCTKVSFLLTDENKSFENVSHHINTYCKHAIITHMMNILLTHQECTLNIVVHISWNHVDTIARDWNTENFCAKNDVRTHTKNTGGRCTKCTY